MSVSAHVHVVMTSLSDTEVWLLVQFHANSWALAFGAPMFGAKLVLPGGLFML